MRLPYHERDAIKDIVVNLRLSGEALESVAVTLYFVSVQPSVHDGDIHPRGAVPQAELIEHQSISLPMVVPKNLLVKSCT
ncbi:hypothetical protein SAMN02745121_08717 [Nannocystis exedens]|uniref:Uncharacterized protein n=1 Tax=Nannocystis exedens TaxID=54 RepID=A0A1I2IIU5_9BACT|nr:hypothetical protein NAEX_06217 [Nannocystis exedens]SFF41600.1 hypothetical protein SAMN02745121_08717 [Nannocystis exedens]